MTTRRALEAERRRRTAGLARAAWDEAQNAPSPSRTLPWLERAHRFVAADRNIAFALATARLACGDAAGALALYETLAAAHDTAEIWTGIAAAALQGERIARATEAMRRRLGRFAMDAAAEAVARRLSAAADCRFCGVTDSGVLVSDVQASARAVRLDGRLVSGAELPAGWRAARRLSVWAGGAPVLGSPIDLAAFRRVEGFVARRGFGLAGWAWHPACPERDPVLRVMCGDAEIVRLTAADLSFESQGSVPLGRPRGFSVARVPAGPLRVVGEDGRDLLGSPLPAEPLPAPPPGRTPDTRPATPGPVSVVVPAYRGRATTRACLASVLANLRPGDRLMVVDDASPEPELRRDLRALAEAGRITLLASCADVPNCNLGFPAAANAGLRAAAGDVVLLNSDTLVFPGWLDGLQAAAHAAADIGTVTPVSNAASVFSVPDPDSARNAVPDAAAGAVLARLAADANGGCVVDVPTAHGFCMFIRADCLAATGLLREDVFAQGYGEENDFSERAAVLGFRHVAAPGVYVAHVGGASFGPAARHLLARNLRLLARLHPGYHAKVAGFAAADPLRDSRVRLDAARWRAGAKPRGAVLLITHEAGGGTARVVDARMAAARRAGLRPVRLAADRRAVGLDDGAAPTPNLLFRLPDGMDALMALLADDRPRRAEVHHLLGHDHAVMALPRRLGIPYDVYVHDYAWLCPRVVLTTGEGRYCGEPDAAVCVGCVARWGRAIEERISPARLRARSAADLAGARRVVAPSDDAAARIRRHFPDVRPVVDAWEQPREAARAGHWGMPRRVAVIGAIGVEKGYEVLLACARDAAARRLPLDFVVIGYTMDDAALLQIGNTWITGPFEAAQAEGLIRAQRAALAFLPSIWPETWCFALSDSWRAGLDAAVFEIGAPAARVRQSGRGWVLPLGLPPSRVNDALLNIQPLADTPGLASARPAAGQVWESHEAP